jgi:hypothetical protein
MKLPSPPGNDNPGYISRSIEPDQGAVVAQGIGIPASGTVGIFYFIR